MEESLAELRKLLQKKKYIRHFIEEGLRFSSSMYLLLIWMRVFQWVLDNPHDVQKELYSSLPHFNKFCKSPTTDNYLKGLTNSFNSLTISIMPSPSGVKRRLADIHDSSGESEEEPPKKEQKSENKKILHIMDDD